MISRFGICYSYGDGVLLSPGVARDTKKQTSEGLLYGVFLMVVRLVTSGNLLFPLAAEGLALTVGPGHVNTGLSALQNTPQPYHSAHSAANISGRKSQPRDGRGRLILRKRAEKRRPRFFPSCPFPCRSSS